MESDEAMQRAADAPSHPVNSSPQRARVKHPRLGPTLAVKTIHTLPWDIHVVLRGNPCWPKVLILLGLASFILIIALTTRFDVGAGMHTGVLSNLVATEMHFDEAGYLNEHAIFHKLVESLQNVSGFVLDANLMLDFDTSILAFSFVDSLQVQINDDLLLHFIGGETISIDIKSTEYFAVVWFGNEINGPVSIVDAHEGRLQVTLPTDELVNSDACARVTMNVAPISKDLLKRGLSKHISFGFVPGQVNCSQSSCQHSMLTCSIVAKPTSVQDRFQACLDQFNFEEKINEADCFALFLLESIAMSCANSAGIDFSDLKGQVHDTANKVANGYASCVMQCSELDCGSYVISLIRTRATNAPSLSPLKSGIPDVLTASPSSPGVLNGTSTPTREPSVSPVTLKPSTSTLVQPLQQTVRPTFQPQTCHPACTCPETDACCCRDGYCAAETCPENYNF